MDIKHWLWQLLIALDQLINVLVTPLHRGAWADETMSSRAWRMEQQGRPWGRVLRPVIDALFYWDANQGREAFMSERLGRQLPPEFRI